MNNPLSIPKKLAVINDIAGYGRCSMAVALPVISALGVQACPVPTSVFSNHTAFPIYHFDDYTAHMPDYLYAWEQLELSFDGIYAGFLGSVAQIEIVNTFIMKNKNSLVLIDPVMGDHGKAYRTITAEHCAQMKHLVRHARIITPNLTEACLLADTPYRNTGWDYDSLLVLAQKLHALGPQKIVITGIPDDDYLINFLFSASNDGSTEASSIRTHIAGQSRSGTGDIFASILAADALNSVPFAASVRKAAEFIRICIEGTSALNVPLKEGVCFENFLSYIVLGNNNSSNQINNQP